MPLGTEVGLGPGDFVLDWDPFHPTPKRGTGVAHFSVHVYCGQTAGGIKIPFGRPRPRPHCVRWGPSFPQKAVQQPPQFLAPSIVAKRSPISATAEHLFYFLRGIVEIQHLDN